jgi:AmiR/NasT family two-component response regulator
MNQVLLVSSTEKGRDSLTALLRENGMLNIAAADSSAKARRMAAQGSYDVIVINTPLSDEFGSDLAVALSASTAAGIIMVVKSELSDGIAGKVESFGVIVVPKPLTRQLFYQALRLTVATAYRMTALRSENEKLRKKLEEMRLVSRAKCVLIELDKMTEEQAHHYIEKQAMDLRKTRKEIAQEILENR